MAYILCLETATTVCSVALCQNGKVVSIRETHEKNSHSSYITLFIEKALADSGISLNSIDAVAVSKGPGSYTGLRIGASTAKGLCHALDIPLIAISTLKAMAYGMKNRYTASNRKNLTKTLFCPMIDARRMEVYSALFDHEINEVVPVGARIIDNSFLHNQLKTHPVVFGGDGADKCRNIITHQNAFFLNDFSLSASFISELSYQKFKQKDFEDVAYFEPYYLKDFIAGKPRVKGLR